MIFFSRKIDNPNIDTLGIAADGICFVEMLLGLLIIFQVLCSIESCPWSCRLALTFLGAPVEFMLYWTCTYICLFPCASANSLRSVLYYLWSTVLEKSTLIWMAATLALMIHKSWVYLIWSCKIPPTQSQCLSLSGDPPKKSPRGALHSNAIPPALKARI